MNIKTATIITLALISIATTAYPQAADAYWAKRGWYREEGSTVYQRQPDVKTQKIMDLAERVDALEEHANKQRIETEQRVAREREVMRFAAADVQESYASVMFPSNTKGRSEDYCVNFLAKIDRLYPGDLEQQNKFANEVTEKMRELRNKVSQHLTKAATPAQLDKANAEIMEWLTQLQQEQTEAE